MEEATENETCILCDEILEAPLRIIQKKGIQSLVKASRHMKDRKHLQLRKYKSLNVHEKCAKSYSTERHINNYLNSQNKKSAQPSTFEHGEHCIFCGKDASDEFIEKQLRLTSTRREKVTCVSTANFQENLIKHLDNRTDEKSRDVFSRIADVDDLAAAGARYHQRCALNFYSKPNKSDERVAVDAAKFIHNYVSNSNENNQFSLYKILTNFKEDKWPALRILKKHLNNIFDNQIIIHSSKDGPILTHRNIGERLLNDFWYKQNDANSNHERRRVVENAAEIILEDIRNIEASNNVKIDVPESLEIFLNTLIVQGKQKTKQVSVLAHSLLSEAVNGDAEDGEDKLPSNATEPLAKKCKL